MGPDEFVDVGLVETSGIPLWVDQLKAKIGQLLTTPRGRTQESGEALGSWLETRPTAVPKSQSPSRVRLRKTME